MSRTESKTKGGDSGSVFDTKIARKLFAITERIDVDPKALYKEVLRLHEERVIRKWVGKSRVKFKDLEAANSQEQATRSRLTRILLDCKEVANIVEPARDATIMKLLSSHGAMIPHTTKTDKRAYLSQEFETRIPFMRTVYMTIEAVEYVIADIDQSHYNLSRQSRLFELTTRPDMS